MFQAVDEIKEIVEKASEAEISSNVRSTYVSWSPHKMGTLGEENHFLDYCMAFF